MLFFSPCRLRCRFRHYAAFSFISMMPSRHADIDYLRCHWYWSCPPADSRLMFQLPLIHWWPFIFIDDIISPFLLYFAAWCLLHFLIWLPFSDIIAVYADRYLLLISVSLSSLDFRFRFVTFRAFFFAYWLITDFRRHCLHFRRLISSPHIFAACHADILSFHCFRLDIAFLRQYFAAYMLRFLCRHAAITLDDMPIFCWFSMIRACHYFAADYYCFRRLRCLSFLFSFCWYWQISSSYFFFFIFLMFRHAFSDALFYLWSPSLWCSCFAIMLFWLLCRCASLPLFCQIFSIFRYDWWLLFIFAIAFDIFSVDFFVFDSFRSACRFFHFFDDYFLSLSLPHYIFFRHCAISTLLLLMSFSPFIAMLLMLLTPLMSFSFLDSILAAFLLYLLASSLIYFRLCRLIIASFLLPADYFRQLMMFRFSLFALFPMPDSFRQPDDLAFWWCRFIDAAFDYLPLPLLFQAELYCFLIFWLTISLLSPSSILSLPMNGTRWFHFLFSDRLCRFRHYSSLISCFIDYYALLIIAAFRLILISWFRIDISLSLIFRHFRCFRCCRTLRPAFAADAFFRRLLIFRRFRRFSFHIIISLRYIFNISLSMMLPPLCWYCHASDIDENIFTLYELPLIIDYYHCYYLHYFAILIIFSLMIFTTLFDFIAFVIIFDLLMLWYFWLLFADCCCQLSFLLYLIVFLIWFLISSYAWLLIHFADATPALHWYDIFMLFSSMFSPIDCHCHTTFRRHFDWLRRFSAFAHAMFSIFSISSPFWYGFRYIELLIDYFHAIIFRHWYSLFSMPWHFAITLSDFFSCRHSIDIFRFLSLHCFLSFGFLRGFLFSLLLFVDFFFSFFLCRFFFRCRWCRIFSIAAIFDSDLLPIDFISIFFRFHHFLIFFCRHFPPLMLPMLISRLSSPLLFRLSFCWAFRFSRFLAFHCYAFRFCTLFFLSIFTPALLPYGFFELLFDDGFSSLIDFASCFFSYFHFSFSFHIFAFDFRHFHCRYADFLSFLFSPLMFSIFSFAFYIDALYFSPLLPFIADADDILFSIISFRFHYFHYLMLSIRHLPVFIISSPPLFSISLLSFAEMLLFAGTPLMLSFIWLRRYARHFISLIIAFFDYFAAAFADISSQHWWFIFYLFSIFHAFDLFIAIISIILRFAFIFSWLFRFSSFSIFISSIYFAAFGFHLFIFAVCFFSLRFSDFAFFIYFADFLAIMLRYFSYLFSLLLRRHCWCFLRLDYFDAADFIAAFFRHAELILIFIFACFDIYALRCWFPPLWLFSLDSIFFSFQHYAAAFLRCRMPSLDYFAWLITPHYADYFALFLSTLPLLDFLLSSDCRLFFASLMVISLWYFVFIIVTLCW